MEKSQNVSNLLEEEARLQRRRHARRSARAGQTDIKPSIALVQSVPSVPVVKTSRGRKRDNVLLQYKNKLCLFMVEEMNSAYKALQVEYSSSSEIGLSIDEEEKIEFPRPAKTDAAESTLRSLFYQVSSKVPSHIRKQLRFPSETYFYELIASHIASELSAFVETSLLEKCQEVKSLESFAALFAILFYQYSPKLVSNKSLWTVFVKGLGQVFQHDSSQGTVRLTALFHALQDNHGLKNQTKLRQTLIRFYYYYASSNAAFVDDFLIRFDVTLDEFIVENLKMLEKGISSQLSERYVRCLGKLQNIPRFKQLDVQTLQKMESVLTGLTISGAPYYPSGEVRIAAQGTLDLCFPKTKLVRRVISGMLQLDFKGVATDLVSTFSPFNALKIS